MKIVLNLPPQNNSWVLVWVDSRYLFVIERVMSRFCEILVMSQKLCIPLITSGIKEKVERKIVFRLGTPNGGA